MSATTQSMKLRFGGFFKQLFSRNEPKAAAADTETLAQERTAPPVETAAPPTTKAAAPVSSGVTLPMFAVLGAFPLELRPKIRQPDGGGREFNAPFDKVLPQLATGVVKVKYGEIRRAAPQLFAPGVECDGVEVALPLNEVLARINPAMLTRRPVQKQIAVPDEITSPFAHRGAEVKVLVGNTNPAPVAPPTAAPAPAAPLPSARPALAPAADGSAPPRDTSLFRRSIPTPGATPATSAAKEPIFARRPAAPAPTPAALTPTPAAPAGPAVPADEPPLFVRKPAGPTPATPVPAAADALAQPIFARKTTPETKPAPAAPIAPAVPAVPRSADPLTAPPVSRAVQPAQPVKPAATESEVILTPLTALAESWPEGIRQEIVQMNIVDARLAMPVELVEAALKRGRVIFPWKLVRSWVRPAPAARLSPHDGTELELPLAVLAPLFVARQKRNGGGQRVTVDETIPNLFFGLPKPEPSPVPKPADTNYYTWGDTSDRARVDDTEFKRKSPGGTDFVAKYATPNEIVSRAAALDQVAGALIALPDGLMVASRIPAEYNGETLAAFLPQIFSKVSQCTKELRMGDLNNLNFTVGNVPWKIFRVNAIFFAAFGNAGEQMPTAELVALAGELDRRR